MHASQEELALKLERAKQIVKVGALYAHYKHPEAHYRVLNLAINEADESVYVVYEAQYSEKIIFLRPLDSWTETLEVGGRPTARFTLHEA